MATKVKFQFRYWFFGFFFVVAIIVPAVTLSLLAFQTVNREVAYSEKRLQVALYAEIQHSASLINSQLSQVKNELSQKLSSSNSEDPGFIFEKWQGSSALVNTPFLLSSSGEILWPSSTAELNKDEEAFLEANAPVFEDKKRVPVYENIAVAYKDDIIKKSKEEGKVTRSSYTIAERALGRDEWSGGSSSANQMSMAQFSQAEPNYQTQVYDQAVQSGYQVSERNVRQQGILEKKGKDQRYDSQYIELPKKFSEITAKSREGIIPRFIDNKLSLLFWKKFLDGNIAGCMINMAGLKERIIGVLPDVYSSARILTVIDDEGKPLIEPVSGKPLSYWRKPFVSFEIGQLLPRWEVAAYITDPKTLTSQAQFTASITALLIFILCISIISGGIVVLRSVYTQVKLAQQKTTFVSNVSHELKTPLTSIRMFAEMLKNNKEVDPEKTDKYLGIVVSETERLTRLINNVLDFSRMENGKKNYEMKDLDITAVIKDVLGSQRIRLEQNGFMVKLTCPDKALFVRADAEAIKQALINLFSNAEKYSEGTKEIEAEVSAGPKKVIIDVRDRGIGIRAADAKNIFNDFYRADDRLTAKVKGTGLGLTITRRIINDHSGEIVYLSREGGGSVFRIQLPLVTA